MSTIVYWRGILLADTQETIFNSRNKPIKTEISSKLAKIRKNIYGCIGDNEPIDDFLNWIRKNKKEKFNGTTIKEFRAFEFDGNELIVWRTKWKKNLKKYIFVEITRRPYEKYKFSSVGSGAQFAAGAYIINNDPIEALLTAAKYDPYTNNTIEMLTQFHSKPEQILDGSLFEFEKNPI